MNILEFPAMAHNSDTSPNKIRYWRLLREMTQEQLADAVGMQKQQISRLETGEREAYVHRLRAIARVLDVETADLLSPMDNPLALDSELADLVAHYKNADPQGRASIRAIAETTARFQHGDKVIPISKRAG